ALPFGRGKTFLSGANGAMEKLIGGWQLNTIVTRTTGFPITALIGSNQSGTGNTSSPDRASWNPAFTGDPIVGLPTKWFDPTAFVVPAFGTFGNTGRNVLRGPALVNWDLSLFKATRITE